MKKIFIIALCSVAILACKKEKEYPNTLPGKTEQLADLKSKQAAILKQVADVEAQLLKLDSTRAIKPKLVSTIQMSTEGFQHFINLQGAVKSENISYVAPRNGMGGYVKNVYIKQGQNVKKGQLVLKLDDQILRQSIEATKSQLAFAQNVYNKTKTLWDQNIGTEVQLLSAKNNVDAIQNQINIQEEQLKTYLVYADQSGVADIVNIKSGEMFTGASIAGPQIQIVNNSELKVTVDVPENYAAKVKVGAKVVIDVPSMNKTFNTTITRIGQSINAGSRGFTAECNIPAGLNLKPNMGASVKILNHANTKAIVVPVNIIQSDEKGKYVYLMKSGANNKKIAHKTQVTIGEIYGDEIEVLSGIASGDVLVTQGYQNLYEGQMISDK